MRLNSYFLKFYFILFYFILEKIDSNIKLKDISKYTKYK